MTIPTPGYPEYTALIASNARLETKIDLILQRLDVQDSVIRQIRSRVEDLERGRARSKGVLPVLSAASGVIGALITTVVKLFASLSHAESSAVHSLHPVVEKSI